MTAPAPVLFVDADNTLWDTDGVFAKAQRALLADVSSALAIAAPAGDSLAFVRDIDQTLAERHHAGLRYPPRLLIRATELVLRGAKLEVAARAAWRARPRYEISAATADQIEARFRAALGCPPEARAGVREGLQRLHAAGCLLLVVTEGAKVRAERNLERLGLEGFFDRLIEAQKSPELYRRVLRLTKAVEHAFAVGDQLDRDIAPAKAAGVETIFFPGGFQPRWSPALDVAGPDHVVGSFAEIPDIVLNASRSHRLAATA